MSTPALTPGPEPSRTRVVTAQLVKGIAAVLLMAAIGAATAYAVFEWRIRSEQATAASELTLLREQTLREVGDLRAELRQQQEALQTEMRQVSDAAAATGLLLEQSGEVTGLQTRLAEIDTLKAELHKTQTDMEAKLQAMERSVLDKVAQQEQQTAQAVSLELRYKSLLVKAQGETMLAQMHWAESNRGLARDELALAARTLQQALGEAPESARPAVQKAVEAAEQTRTALILEQSTARDALNMLWHQVSDLLTPQ